MLLYLQAVEVDDAKQYIRGIRKQNAFVCKCQCTHQQNEKKTNDEPVSCEQHRSKINGILPERNTLLNKLLG